MKLIKEGFMKNHYVLAVLFCSLVFSGSAMAQEKVVASSNMYVKLYGAYGLLTPGSTKLTTFGTTAVNTQGQFNVGKDGLGAGLHYGLGIGCVVNDFLNMGLDLDILKGKKLSAGNYDIGGPNDYFGHTGTIDYSITSLIPNVTFKALSKPSYFIYTRLGIIMAIKTKYTNIDWDTATYPQATAAKLANSSTTEYSFKLHAGAQIALGTQFNLTDKIRGFAEITGNYLPISPSSSAKTGESRQYDGNNVIEKKTTNTPVSTTFSSSGTLGGSTTSLVEPSVVYNVNSIGLSLGIVYKF